MDVVDSSGWLEYFGDGHNADVFAEPILQVENVIVPTICLYEVFKILLRQRNPDAALQAIARMRMSEVVPLDDAIAIGAAELGAEYKLAMADSIILATARAHHAVLWTQNEDFEGLDGVKYFAKI